MNVIIKTTDGSTYVVDIKDKGIDNFVDEVFTSPYRKYVVSILGEWINVAYIAMIKKAKF